MVKKCPNYYIEKLGKIYGSKIAKISLMIHKYQAQILYSMNQHIFINGAIYTTPKSVC